MSSLIFITCNALSAAISNKLPRTFKNSASSFFGFSVCRYLVFFYVFHLSWSFSNLVIKCFFALIGIFALSQITYYSNKVAATDDKITHRYNILQQQGGCEGTVRSSSQAATL